LFVYNPTVLRKRFGAIDLHNKTQNRNWFRFFKSITAYASELGCFLALMEMNRRTLNWKKKQTEKIGHSSRLCLCSSWEQYCK